MRDGDGAKRLCAPSPGCPRREGSPRAAVGCGGLGALSRCPPAANKAAAGQRDGVRDGGLRLIPFPWGVRYLAEGMQGGGGRGLCPCRFVGSSRRARPCPRSLGFFPRLGAARGFIFPVAVLAQCPKGWSPGTECSAGPRATRTAPARTPSASPGTREHLWGEALGVRGPSLPALPALPFADLGLFPSLNPGGSPEVRH